MSLLFSDMFMNNSGDKYLIITGKVSNRLQYISDSVANRIPYSYFNSAWYDDELPNALCRVIDCLRNEVQECGEGTYRSPKLF